MYILLAHFVYINFYVNKSIYLVSFPLYSLYFQTLALWRSQTDQHNAKNARVVSLFICMYPGESYKE